MSDCRDGGLDSGQELRTSDGAVPIGVENASRHDSSPSAGYKRALVVLGMHRSGTSAITRVCSLLGVDLPRTLIVADRDNEAGYWEPQSINQLNEELLASAGSSWDDSSPFPESWYETPTGEEFRQRAIDSLHREYGDSTFFVLKDPRICRLVPLWMGALESFGASPHIILSVRNPLEVAASLEKRDGLSQSDSLQLWMRHVLDAEFYSRGWPRSIVSYDDLLMDPLVVIGDVAADLRFEWPHSTESSRTEIITFLRKKLRHHRVSEDQLEASAEVPPRVKEIYSLLRTRADTDHLRYQFDAVREEIDRERLSSTSLEIVSKLPGAGFADVIEPGLEAPAGGTVGRRQAAAPPAVIQRQLLARISKLEANIVVLQRALHNESELSRLTRRVAEQDRRIRQLQSAIEESTSRFEAEFARAEKLTAELAQRDEVIRDLREKLALRDAAAEGRTREVRHLLGQVEFLRLSQPPEDQDQRSLPQRVLGALLSLSPIKPRGFDARYYLARNRDVNSAGYDPLVHYLVFGRKEGRRPRPVEHTFSQYDGMAMVLDSGLFDLQYYSARNADVVAAGRDLVEHFLMTGAWESRMPSPGFSPAHYLKSYPDVAGTGMNPLVHYLLVGRFGGRAPLPAAGEASGGAPRVEVVEQPVMEEEENLSAFGPTDIQLIAFYLPQFHPIPENDQFWGKGFTEWSNVTRAKAAFRGHYQPRRPGELGYYDLRVKEVQKRQIEMAKAHGIHGFCFHYYWFSGKAVMRRPLEQLLEDTSLDIPFCLHWANEPWTSSWDGCNEKGVLLRQNHTPEDDIAFIRGIRSALLDERYIRINGRPLLAVYRPGLFPDIKRTVERWREYCIKEKIGELYLVVTQQPFDGAVDPRECGFDAAVEFPPHNLPLVDVGYQVELYDPQFPGRICSYPHIVRASLEKPVPNYTLFRGIMPGFDATPRRRDSAVYLGNSPEVYQNWLEGLCEYTRKNLPAEKRLIFINAWNEWAEGAYLEPDGVHGFAYLNATARALSKSVGQKSVRKVVFLGHDAVRAGSQILLLDLLRWVTERTSTEVRVILGKGGELIESYKAVAEVLALDEMNSLSVAARAERIYDFTGGDPDLIYVNTVVSGEYLPLLGFPDVPVITHIHELENSIRSFASAGALNNTLRLSQKIIAASEPVATNLITRHGIDSGQIETVYSFIRTVAPEQGRAVGRDEMRRLLGIGPRDVAIFACGTRDWRKAPDIFVEVAAKLLQRGISNFKCFWIGAQIAGHYAGLETSLVSRGLSSHLVFLGEKDSPRNYFLAGDIFLLPSREDPFPLVCLEAAECGLPTVCFAEAGGMPGFVEEDAGVVVPFEDLEAMTDAVARLIEKGEEREHRGLAARRKLHERHTSEVAMPEIFHIMRGVSESPPVVSVIIPSYNYDQYLDQRLQSIFNQTFQDFEIILEDDCSTDQTLSLLSKYEARRNLRVERHTRNQGVFAMWVEGLKAAAGKIIWIAEEDDLCEPQLLEKLLPSFDDDRVKLAYCQSAVIDEYGDVAGDYTHCFPEFSETKWTKPYVQPIERELRDGLAIKNFILNASGVLFRKPDIGEASQILSGFSLSGDWSLYLHMLKGGCISYCPEKLNYHRRHSDSLIGKKDNLNLLIAEAGRIHRQLQQIYSFPSDFRQKMATQWLALWREKNPLASEQEFWANYGSESSGIVPEEAAMSSRT